MDESGDTLGETSNSKFQTCQCLYAGLITEAYEDTGDGPWYTTRMSDTGATGNIIDTQCNRIGDVERKTGSLDPPHPHTDAGEGHPKVKIVYVTCELRWTANEWPSIGGRVPDYPGTEEIVIRTRGITFGIRCEQGPVARLMGIIHQSDNNNNADQAFTGKLLKVEKM